MNKYSEYTKDIKQVQMIGATAKRATIANTKICVEQKDGQIHDMLNS
jgi:hypothetical protein